MAAKTDTMGYGKAEDNAPLHCLECGQELSYGRRNRKFCSVGCKNHYHNRFANSSRIVKMRIINALQRNYRILEKLLKLDITAIGRMEVEQMGFRCEYVTSHRKVRRHNEYWCFDIRYNLSPTKMSGIGRTWTKLPPEEAGPD